MAQAGVKPYVRKATGSFKGWRVGVPQLPGQWDIRNNTVHYRYEETCFHDWALALAWLADWFNGPNHQRWMQQQLRERHDLFHPMLRSDV